MTAPSPTSRTDDAGPGPADSPDPAPGRSRAVGPGTVFVATLIAALAAMAVVLVLARDDGQEAIPVEEALENLDVSTPVPEGAEVAEIGRRAPDVQLAYLDGGVQRLSELRGRPVVLNFWSSTCAPCLQEMPAFQAVAAANEGAVTVVGVDVADTEAAGREMVERTGVRYRNARDPRSEIFAVFGGTALPRTVLIDADGTVVGTHSGALDRAELNGLLSEQGWR